MSLDTCDNVPVLGFPGTGINVVWISSEVIACTATLFAWKYKWNSVNIKSNKILWLKNVDILFTLIAICISEILLKAAKNIDELMQHRSNQELGGTKM